MQLRGLFVAIVTPFRDGGLDEAALAAHASWLVDEGASGIVVCGTTGESATLHNDEKIRAMNVVFEAVGHRTTVIGGIGNNSTAESLHQIARVDEEARVHGIMCVVPYYNKPDQAGITAHFRALADASRNPLVIYNVPGRTVVSMTAETMLDLAAHPNIVGIKEASADLFMDTFLLERLPADVSVLSGDDATALPFIAIGGHGVISVVGNVAPRLMAGLCQSALTGDLASARAANHTVAHLHRLMFSAPNPLPAKAVASHLGFGDGDVRLPLVALDAERRAALVSACEALGVTR